MAEIIELMGFVMEGLYNINKHFTHLSSGINLGKYKKNNSQRIVLQKIILLKFWLNFIRVYKFFSSN